MGMESKISSIADSSPESSFIFFPDLQEDINKRISKRPEKKTTLRNFTFKVLFV
jgi:hypothetical protein